jgi:A/G-specific adenine glycosylase
VNLNLFRNKLVKWYGQNKRDLPWRRTQDPYAIWVSEIMLQQTQVATVIPYYEKFLRRFPTVQKLAQAGEEAVLAQWSGLGYYRRAKFLHRGARYVTKDLKGKIPQAPEELKKIPGIGDYTAGAIASIAFDRPVPLVDGNVIRVLSRLFALKGHARDPRLQKNIWVLARGLVPKRSAGDFNQALMELGATLCRTSLPSCERCPLFTLCAAGQTGRAEDFPEPAPQKKTRQLHRVAAICQKDAHILLVKRKKPRWFEGMWELPHEYCDDPKEGQRTLTDFLLETLGLRLKDPRPVPTTHHQITHHRITTQAWSGRVSGPPSPSQLFDSIKFFSISQWRGLALPNLDRKVLQRNFTGSGRRKDLG